MYMSCIFHILLTTLSVTSSKHFTLDDILSGAFNDHKWNGTWFSDTEFWFKDSNYNIRIFDASKNTNKIYLKADIYSEYDVDQIDFSHNMKYALFKQNKNIISHCEVAQYAIWDVRDEQYFYLHNHEFLQYVKWAPKRTALVYVYKNNIYYVPDIANPSLVQQITDDGIPGVVYNGIRDYIYKGSTLWFSPNGNRLAFVHFSDENVADHLFVKYGDSDDQYPQAVAIKYPKVGTVNPSVMVKYVDLEETSSKVTELKDLTNTEALTEDYVFSNVIWANTNDIVGVFLNRVQNTTSAVRCNLNTHACTTIYTEKKRHGWITISTPLFNNDGSRFLVISPESEGDDLFNHLSIIHKNGFAHRKRLTYGKREVSSIYKWDEIRNLIYYLSTVENQYGNQQVFVFNLLTNSDVCLTCEFETPEGFCKFASAEFSLGSSYAVITCSGPGPSVTQIHRFTLGKTENSNYIEWESNRELRKVLSQYDLPVQKNLNVGSVQVRFFLPGDLNENEDTQYPMIIYVYGGPNSNLILNEYSIGLENFFATHRKYIYAFIDGRGSGGLGHKNLFEVYRKLGTVEVEDLIETTRYLINTYWFIDSRKVGLWGGSYGGFLTLLTLAKDKDNVFLCVLAIAPVTNFNHYSSLYAEKYMGLNTEDDNLQGYLNTDITKYVDGLRNKLFCIVHGSADTNVHYQHSMLLIKALQQKNVHFWQQSYPDEGHNFDSRLSYLYRTVDNFFKIAFSVNNR